VQVGDQVLEVNGISFLNIVHSDAANALRYTLTLSIIVLSLYYVCGCVHSGFHPVVGWGGSFPPKQMQLKLNIVGV